MNALLINSGVNCKLYRLGTKYYGIWQDHKYYCDENGYPFVCTANEAEWAINQSRPDTSVKDENGNPATDENGNVIQETVTDNSTNIDLSNMTITLPDGKLLIADQIIYDESTKTYTIDSHDTYNTEINYYYTWNYYINYTSITYIGQTEEYNKYYEVYYELPDGRDSADLTKEELEQLNLGIDVMTYERVADDTSVRALYHFDGDTEDSSYWNYLGYFRWDTGASITYLDSGAFNGCLYLDEGEHQFTIWLPSNLSGGDFTLQFRYYQSDTIAPVTDSSIKIGGITVLTMNGDAFFNASGRQLATIPCGTWNEIAIARRNNELGFFINGKGVYATTDTTTFGSSITFTFGSQQQTYKYIDELRVLNTCPLVMYSNYTCTSVPYDTNLALVLPGSSIPVADEYWSITSSEENLISGDFSKGYIPSSVMSGVYNGSSTDFDHPFSFHSIGFLQFGYNTYVSSLIGQDSYARLTRKQAFDIRYVDREDWVWYWVGGLFLSLGDSSPKNTDPIDYSKEYTFSVVTSDGAVYSIPVAFYKDKNGNWDMYDVELDCPWGTLCTAISWRKAPRGDFGVAIVPGENVGDYVDIVYCELVEGSETDLAAEWVTSVVTIDKDQINTPTLAVKTDLEITSTQIGGVRPSVPQKGMVWGLVQGGYITSLQIYNGYAWEAVDGRIWTGERWIPYSSYNVITLQDMYDIVDSTQNYEYIYSESGFWAWWQKSWNAFVEKLFSVLGVGSGSSGCQHAYVMETVTEATCTTPGERKYTCSLCGDEYTETVPALGHDWLPTEDTETTYELPPGTSCPDCGGADFTAELDEGSGMYSLTCNSCGTTWTVQAEVTYGQTTYTCSRCGETYVESKAPESGLFEAIGNFIANGIGWVTDKLSQLIDSLSGINSIFSDFMESVKEKAGDFPAFLGAVIALLPEDLMTVIWFGVVAAVVLAVWKKWFQ